MADDTVDGGRIRQATTEVKLDYIIGQVDKLSARFEAAFSEHDSRIRTLERIASGSSGTSENLGELESRLRVLEVGQARIDEKIGRVGLVNGIGAFLAGLAGVFLHSPLP